MPNLAKKLGGGEIIVKDEGRLPTGSFKARGLVMAVSMAKALGIKHMAMPTNGNAGAALAAYASRAGIKTTVFCPEDTPEVNVSEIELQGATVYRVNGLIDDCGKIVGEGKTKVGWFDASTLKEPYRIEGKKTMGLELAEQLGWDVPDAIFYPTGGGTGLIGMWKAFAELEAIGFIGKKRPRMIAVQAEGCAPIVRAYEAGEEHAPRFENAHTIASGIRVPAAVGDFLILRAVRESGGFAIAVSDEAITAAVDDVARTDGLLLCPEGGATYAAYKQCLKDGRVKKTDRVMLFNCATGLKYPLPPVTRTTRPAPSRSISECSPADAFASLRRSGLRRCSWRNKTPLVICRIILGAGEGPAGAVAVHAIYKWFPDEKRTLPTAILSQGSAFGVIIAVPALNWVIVNYSWHHAFGVLGVVGLMWVVAWLIMGREGPLVQSAAANSLDAERFPYAKLLTSRTFVGCCAATFGAYWALSLGLTWFTPFIIKALGFSQQDAGLISILPWVVGACVVLLAGWVSQVLMARGMSTRNARGVLGAAPLVIGGLILLLMPAMSGKPGVQIALLVAGTGITARSMWFARR